MNDKAFVTSRTVDADPFALLVDRIASTTRDKVNQAFFAHTLTDGGAQASTGLADAIAEALRSEYLVDVAGVLAERQATLTERVNEERLARVPTNVADDWRAAKDGYLATFRQLDDDGVPPPAQGLRTFTLNALRERLASMGVVHEPADIDVRIENYHAILPTAVVNFFAGGTPPALSLADLAYRNIGDNDPVRLKAVDRQGNPIAHLDDPTLRRLIRELDVHRRYPAYLETTLRTGIDANARRASTVTAMRAHARLLANEARLAYYLPEMRASFRPDHAYRGYQWVKAILDNPAAAGRATVENHTLVVSQLTYRGAEVRDVFMIGVRNPQSVPAVILYTPDAPDGITFREFDNRQDAARRFLYAPAFREYLLDRLPLEHARVHANGTRAFAGDRLANWVLGGNAGGNYTFTAEPFGERQINGDIFHALYDTDVQLGQRNARWLTTSAGDAQGRWQDEFQRRMVVSVAELVKDVVTAPVHAAAAGWKLYDSVKAGDTRQSVVDFPSLYVASIWAAPGVQQFARAATGRGIIAGRFRVASTIVDARAPAPQKVVFDAQYRAGNVRRLGRADEHGVYTIGGKTYIDHDGAMYGVRFDAGYGTWRLNRPTPGSGAWGPAIARAPGGGWTFRHVGLPGGSGRAYPLPAHAATVRRADVFDDLTDELERAFPDVAERELVAARIRAERTGGLPPAEITGAQRQRWTEAHQRAAARSRARDMTVEGMPPEAAMDLSSRSLPAGWRRVPAVDVPATLYFYDMLPYPTSRLRRLGGVGTIHTELLAQGFRGIRATSLNQDTPFDMLDRVMGYWTRRIHRTRSFVVRFDTGRLVRTTGMQTRPPVDVYTRIGGPANQYLLVPRETPGALRLDTYAERPLSDFF